MIQREALRLLHLRNVERRLEDWSISRVYRSRSTDPNKAIRKAAPHPQAPLRSCISDSDTACEHECGAEPEGDGEIHNGLDVQTFTVRCNCWSMWRS